MRCEQLKQCAVPKDNIEDPATSGWPPRKKTIQRLEKWVFPSSRLISVGDSEFLLPSYSDHLSWSSFGLSWNSVVCLRTAPNETSHLSPENLELCLGSNSEVLPGRNNNNNRPVSLQQRPIQTTSSGIPNNMSCIDPRGLKIIGERNHFPLSKCLQWKCKWESTGKLIKLVLYLHEISHNSPFCWNSRREMFINFYYSRFYFMLWFCFAMKWYRFSPALVVFYH